MQNRHHCGDIAEEIELAREYCAFLFANGYITEKECSKIRTKAAKKAKENRIFITEPFEIVRKFPREIKST